MLQAHDLEDLQTHSRIFTRISCPRDDKNSNRISGFIFLIHNEKKLIKPYLYMHLNKRFLLNSF